MAVLDVPAEREQARAYLWSAAYALRSGGQLLITGSSAADIRPALSDAEALYGLATILGHKGYYIVAQVFRRDQIEIPRAWRQTSPLRPQIRFIGHGQAQYTIVTMPGIFAWDRVDESTALLLDHLGAETDTETLDLGCGYGLLGLAAAKTGARVTLVDDDLRAVRCVKASIQANDLEHCCHVIASDVTSALRDRHFDLILCNPPFEPEPENSVTARMIHEARDRLRPGGRLRIVVSRFLTYDQLVRDTFGNAVETIARSNYFHVIEAVR
jgi:16S rRNA (guanine1207-N2)-methyltransferase